MSYLMRDTTSGLRQRETASLYAGAETATNIQLNAGMSVGSYRPRGARPGEWLGTLDDDRSYLTSAFYQSPTGQFGYGAQYPWGAAGARGYDTLAPSLWVAPKLAPLVCLQLRARHLRPGQHQHVVSGTWDITRGQSLAARWVEHDGGYYRLSYRRALAPSVEAFGVYTSDPYDPGRFDVKVVWAKAPVPRP